MNGKAEKEKKTDRPKGMKLFWKIQWECFRRSVTVFLMYLFMSLLLLVCQVINQDKVSLIEIVLGVVCILCGMAFNAHLCFHIGADHYDTYLSGCLHRKNALFGIESGGDHRVEREFRVWKGFLIGFYVGIVVIVLGSLAGSFQNTEGGAYAVMFLSMFAGWAIMPIGWIRSLALPDISFFWSIAFIVIPIIVSGIFYILGAKNEKRKKREEQERRLAVEEAAKKAKETVRQQTEEQRRKTLQSKKKK